MAGRRPCETCELLGTGICINNRTCQCFDGFLGISCQDPVTTSTKQSSASVSEVNIAAIVASILGGALLTLIIGLVIFFIWKRRVKKKSLTFSPSTSMTTTTSCPPIIAPALYDLSSSGGASSVTSAQTMTYHLYEELL